MLNPGSYVDLISGRRRGWWAGLQRSVLKLATIPYATAVAGRNLLFRYRVKKSHAIPVPVISVGNITAGGTGKTPLVAWLAKQLVDRGIRVTLISRGYGSRVDGLNDEALEIAQRIPGIPHLLDPNRVRAAWQAVNDHASQLIVLDDGFQHRRIARDLDVVLVDATNPFGYGHLLPRGTLREPPAALQRADLLALTRVDLVEPESLCVLEDQLTRHAPGVPQFHVAYQPSHLLNVAGEQQELRGLQGKSVAAFCGIGNPHAFRLTLEGSGCRLVDFRAFPDHHPFGEEDLESLTRWLTHLHQVDAVICTHKDLVKIPCETLHQIPLWALALQMEVTRGQEALDGCLQLLTADLS